MYVLIKLSFFHLQEIGKELLQVRIKINEEITRLIMFADRERAPPPAEGCKRCEKFDKFVKGLKEVVDTVGADSDPPAGDDAGDDADDANDADADAPAGGKYLLIFCEIICTKFFLKLISRNFS